jgi:hypothetical protein
MRLPTEAELLAVVEASAVNRAFGLLDDLGLGIRADRLAETLARTLVDVLFPFARRELREPQATYEEVAEFVDTAILMAVKEALDSNR